MEPKMETLSREKVERVASKIKETAKVLLCLSEFIGKSLRKCWLLTWEYKTWEDFRKIPP